MHVQRALWPVDDIQAEGPGGTLLQIILANSFLVRKWFANL